MTKNCAICRKKIGTLFSWKYECSSCGQFVCGGHEKSGLCTVCWKQADAIVVLERDDADIRKDGTSLGVVISEPSIDVQSAFFSIKKKAQKVGAFAVLDATVLHSNETLYVPRGKSWDDYKKGKLTLERETVARHTVRGEAIKRRP